MLVTNQTSQDYWFGPLHLLAGVGQTLTVDDTTATSLYWPTMPSRMRLTTSIYRPRSRSRAPRRRFRGRQACPKCCTENGSPEGLHYAPQGSLYMRGDGEATRGSCR